MLYTHIGAKTVCQEHEYVLEAGLVNIFFLDEAGHKHLPAETARIQIKSVR